jgi:hypothetical protein
MFKTIREIASILGYKDSRSATNWCKENFVAILKDVRRKEPYVLATEFEEARLRTSLKYLKQKHGKSFTTETINYYMHQHSQTMVAIEANNKRKKIRSHIGENEKRFLSILSK